MENITLHDLSIKHDYYCSDSNYYCSKDSSEYQTFNEFIDSMGSADLDLNLLFRWDINKLDDGTYYMFIGIFHQRKGRFWPNTISCITEEDVPEILKFLEPRLQKIKQIWAPLL